MENSRIIKEIELTFVEIKEFITEFDINLEDYEEKLDNFEKKYKQIILDKYQENQAIKYMTYLLPIGRIFLQFLRSSRKISENLIEELGADNSLVEQYIQLFFKYLEGDKNRLEILEKLKSLDNIPITRFFTKYIETFFEYLQNNLNDPKVIEYLRTAYIFLSDISIPNKNIQYAFLLLKRNDPFEESIRNKFIEEYEKAINTNQERVDALFEALLNSIIEQLNSQELLEYSRYTEIGFENIVFENLTWTDFFSILMEKENIILKNDDKKIKDIVKDLLRRFGEAIENYLKIVLASITNLSKISKNQKLVSFHKNLGKYYKLMNLNRSYLGDYIDIRNSIFHNSTFVFPDKLSKKITIKFIFQRYRKKKRQFYDLKDLFSKFKRFNTFTSYFLKFFEAYLFERYLENDNQNRAELLKKIREQINLVVNDKYKLREIINEFH